MILKRRGEDVAHLVVCGLRSAADAGSTPLCGKAFFSQSQLVVQIIIIIIIIITRKVNAQTTPFKSKTEKYRVN